MYTLFAHLNPEEFRKDGLVCEVLVGLVSHLLEL